MKILILRDKKFANTNTPFIPGSKYYFHIVEGTYHDDVQGYVLSDRLPKTPEREREKDELLAEPPVYTRDDYMDLTLEKTIVSPAPVAGAALLAGPARAELAGKVRRNLVLPLCGDAMLMIEVPDDADLDLMLEKAKKDRIFWTDRMIAHGFPYVLNEEIYLLEDGELRLVFQKS